ncbi:MAG: AAA family ATPase [Candidatus Magasanikbacteria bacterium]|jgi:ATP-dependent DNA helicase PIF1|nr:AAA family ATPase [Candidatus Magasanikbacteria bacterium]
MKMKFCKEAKKALKLINETDEHLYITGKAGTGKSTLLAHIRLQAKKRTVVLAPTGIAAIHVNGETIHSFFGLKPGFEKDEAAKKRIDEKRAKKYRHLKTIMIDEISMVRADLLDAIDIFLRKARQDKRPFGGVQMVFFGDLYQLPPVVTSADKDKFYSEYEAPYFFHAEVFKGQSDLFSGGFNVQKIELNKIYRQTDREFIDVLNAVREGIAGPNEFNLLNQRCDYQFEPPKNGRYIYLMTTNADANRINMKRLAELPGDERSYTATQKGSIARNLYPNDEVVTLKEGAQIMFVCNDGERRWVNGTIGTILEIKETYSEERKAFEPLVKIKKDDGLVVDVGLHLWEISKYVFQKGQFEREMIGSFRQIPFKLAWAITIHKSQGKTFDNVIIDMGRGSFAHGQTYVALSRCTSLEGIVLKKPIGPRSIIMDQRVKAFAGEK